MKRTVELNGIDISEAVIAVRTSAGLEGAIIASWMEVEVSPNHPCLKYADLRGTITLETFREGASHKLFKGLVLNGSSNGGNYILQCKDASQLLSEKEVKGGFGNGMIPAEVVYYLAAAAALEGLDPKNFHTGDGKSLADTPWLFRKRKFVFIAPAPYLGIGRVSEGTGQELRLAHAWLYRAVPPNSKDDDYIASVTASDPATRSHWEEGETRIRLYVNATNFLEAIEEGKKKLRILLDIISFGTNTSTPTIIPDLSGKLLPYERSRTLVEIRETPWVYVRDTVGECRFWLHWEAPNRIRKCINVIPDDPVMAVCSIFRNLAEEDEDRLSESQRASLNALHALRQVRESEDAKDSLDHVWRCMEFMVAGYKSDPLFSASERSSVVAMAKNAVDAPFADINKRDLQIQRIENVLNNKLNETALRTKWKFLCRDLGFDFPSEDENFLWGLRKNRNDYQHGHGTKVNRHETDRAAAILEKVLAVKVAKDR